MRPAYDIMWVIENDSFLRYSLTINGVMNTMSCRLCSNICLSKTFLTFSNSTDRLFALWPFNVDTGQSMTLIGFKELQTKLNKYVNLSDNWTYILSWFIFEEVWSEAYKIGYYNVSGGPVWRKIGKLLLKNELKLISHLTQQNFNKDGT